MTVQTPSPKAEAGSQSEALIVALGDRRYRIERPFGAITAAMGKVTDVATSSDSTVFLLTRCDPSVDARRDCVHVLSSDGRLLRSWGATRIYDAHMIAIDAQDRVWVVDRDMHEIVVFDVSGTELFALGRRGAPGEPFNHPADIAFAPDGKVWVADGYGNGHIHRVSTDGKLELTRGKIGVAPGEFLTVHGIAVASDGTVIVADRENSRVQTFTPGGDLIAVWTGFHRPSDIWIDADDNVFISDAIPTLHRLDVSGNRLGRCRPVLNGAHGISGDAAGNLYLAEGTPSRLTKLVPV